METVNNHIFTWNGHHGLPGFARIFDGAFGPAFASAFDRHNREIDAIAADPCDPDFDNTIVALETSGEGLARVSALFWNHAGADSNDKICALERDIAPKMSRHYSAVTMNRPLFDRFDAIWRDRDPLDLNDEKLRVLEKHWKGFVRAGAQLGGDDQNRLAAVNEELAGLGAKFSQNVLADEAD